MLFGCNAVKRVNKNELLLKKNTFIVDGKIIKSEEISRLSFHNKNSHILGIPVRLHIYNLARPNKDSIFDAWINKNSKRKQRYIDAFSKKQFQKIKKTSMGFNNWLLKTGEAPEILDSLKINKTKLNLERYYFSKGWFDRTINYKVNIHGKQRASLEYEIFKGDPFKISEIKTDIKTKILDSIYHACLLYTSPSPRDS